MLWVAEQLSLGRKCVDAIRCARAPPSPYQKLFLEEPREEGVAMFISRGVQSLEGGIRVSHQVLQYLFHDTVFLPCPIWKLGHGQDHGTEYGLAVGSP